MDILLQTLTDAIPMFIVIGSIAAFISLLYIVVEDGKPKKITKKLSWDLVKDTRYMSLE